MSLKANVTKACNALSQTDEGKAVFAQAVENIKKEIRSKSRDKVRATLLPIVAGILGVPLIEGEGKASGSLVMDSDHAKYEQAKKRLQRLVNAIIGHKPSENSRIEFTKRQVSAVKGLLNQFEGETVKDQVNALKALLAQNFA